NTQLIYREDQASLETTYPFTIIAQALTDTPTAGLFLSMEVVEEKLRVKPVIRYETFLNLLTSAQSVDYRKIIEPLDNVDFKTFGFSSFPQIKQAGLPWFYPLDSDKALMIGSILAKSRTKPLDVGAFAKKNANPL